MALVMIPTANRISLKLNDGKTQTGAIKTVSVALPTLKKTEWDNAVDSPKALAVINLLTPVLSKSLYRAELTRNSYFEDDE